MSQGAPENVNPAWQDILDALPEDLHPLITPKLEDWDKRVQDKLQETRSPYEPYQPLVEHGIDIEQVQQALWLAHQLNENPQEVVQKAIESFNLDYVPKSAIENPSTTDPYEDPDDMTDLSGLENHPAFKALMEKVEAAQGILTAQQQQEQEAQETAELEEYLKSLHENPEYGEFDDLFVTSLMAQGVEAEDAIKQYQQIISDAVSKVVPQNDTVTPPVVMGGSGTSGTGIPNEPVKMGNLSKGGVVDLALQFLEQNDTNKS